MFKSTRIFPIIAILGLVALISSACAPEVTVPTVPTKEANFRLLVSDEANDIGDFEHLNVTISSIGVQQVSNNSTWLQFSPDTGTIDLKTLQGKNAREIWSGNVTPGQYNKVFVYVSDVQGVLASNNGTTNVKLPSGKLQILKQFTVSENSTTSFVFDVTVIKAGQSGKYVLKPQIAESGTDKDFSEVKGSDKEQKQEQEREHGRLQLRLEGDARPGAEVVLVVMEQGEAVTGATVTVNGQQIGTTDSEGKISITIPENGEEVEIKATLGDKSGKLELEFEEGMEETELRGTIAEINGNIWTVTVGSAAKAVDVGNAEIEGNPQIGSKLEIKGVDNNGVIIASEVSVRQGESESEKSSEDRDEEENEDEDEEASESEGPPVIPHTLQGRSDCLACHGPNGIEPFPTNHTGRTNDICTTCHQPSS